MEDWLATPSQRLAEVTGGAVFHDESGELSRVRAALGWYPHDVWLHVLRCQWQRISREEPFPGRCAEVGDELGSAVVTAQLVRDLMRLWLLMIRRPSILALGCSTTGRSRCSTPGGSLPF